MMSGSATVRTTNLSCGPGEHSGYSHERYTLASSDLQSRSVQLNGTELELSANDNLPNLAGVPIAPGEVR